jgi:hypothetical protein
MKEPSELDITLLRDLCDKFFYHDMDSGAVRVNLSVAHMQQRKDSLRRFLDHYEHMSEEISRLLLEKHRVD